MWPDRVVRVRADGLGPGRLAELVPRGVGPHLHTARQLAPHAPREQVHAWTGTEPTAAAPTAAAPTTAAPTAAAAADVDDGVDFEDGVEASLMSKIIEKL